MGYEIAVMLDGKLPQYPLVSFVNYITPDTCFISAFGNNGFRLQWCERITKASGSLILLKHHSVYVSPKEKIRSGVITLPYAVVNTGTILNDGCVINIGTIIDHDCILEPGVHIAPGAIVKGENRVTSCERIESGVVVERVSMK